MSRVSTLVVVPHSAKNLNCSRPHKEAAAPDASPRSLIHPPRSSPPSDTPAFYYSRSICALELSYWQLPLLSFPFLRWLHGVRNPILVRVPSSGSFQSATDLKLCRRIGCSIPCLTNADTGSCTPTENPCLCANDLYLRSTTDCIQSSCSAADLQTAAVVARQICSAAVRLFVFVVRSKDVMGSGSIRFCFTGG